MGISTLVKYRNFISFCFVSRCCCCRSSSTFFSFRFCHDIYLYYAHTSLVSHESVRTFTFVNFYHTNVAWNIFLILHRANHESIRYIQLATIFNETLLNKHLNAHYSFIHTVCRILSASCIAIRVQCISFCDVKIENSKGESGRNDERDVRNEKFQGNGIIEKFHDLLKVARSIFPAAE